MTATSANQQDNFAQYPQGFGIEWTSKRSFRLNGYDFDVAINFEDFLVSDYADSGDRFYLAKTPDLMRRYVNLIQPRPPRTILEIGVFRGGGAAFLQMISNAERLLALEISIERLAILDRFIAREGIEESLRVEYGVDQANSDLVRQLTTDHFGEGRSIDLVIDDASHLLGPTRKSFETVFPMLRPGGEYVIEDFANSHILSTRYLGRANEGRRPAQKLVDALLSSSLEADQKPLHLLAVELMLASVNAPHLIRRVIVDRHWLRVIRGHADFDDPDDFDLRALAEDQFSLLESSPSAALSEVLQGNHKA